MSRMSFVIYGSHERERIADLAWKIADGSRVEIRAPRRTLPQNNLMWAMLTALAAQARHNGRAYTAEQWKVIFMHACGREVQFLPSLDGSTFVPWGQESSKLSVAEMSELIEFMKAWGAQNGVVFQDDLEGTN